MPDRRGLVLVEWVIILGMLFAGILVVYIAADPGDYLAKARDRMRENHLVRISQALNDYRLGHNGSLPPEFASSTISSYLIGGQGEACAPVQCTDLPLAVFSPRCLDLSLLLGSEIPHDPRTGSEADTRYYMMVRGDNRIVVGACDPETVPEISRIVE